VRDDRKRAQERSEKRVFEAFQSPKWSPERAAAYCIAWLKSKALSDTNDSEQGSNEREDDSRSRPPKAGSLPQDATLRDAVGYILHRMVLDGEFASAMARVLDTWRAWAEVGGMRQADYEVVRDGTGPEVFAQAVVLMALVKGSGDDKQRGTLATDLQECFELWKTVRLG
jgi:hypothetical protein